MTEPAKILSIEDEATVRRSIVGYLEDSGYEMLEAENGRIGLEVFENQKPDLVLCDLRMPEVDGLTVLAEVANKIPQTPFIIVSGTGDMGDAIQALKLGAWDYIRKPIEDMAVLEHSIEKALERARLVRENREYREHLEETNKRLRHSLQQLEEDEAAARRIQFQLLPEDHVSYRDFEFSRFLKTSAYLSGDFADYFQIDSDNWVFYIADVSGHGVSSAFVTVLLKSTMNHLLDQYRREENDVIFYPEKVLRTINEDLMQRDFDKYLTMFYGCMNVKEGRLRYVNGGQFPYPMLFDGQETHVLEGKNLPVGLFDVAEYNSQETDLPERFVLGMFSDGVLEILPHQRLQEKEGYLRSQVSTMDVTIERLIEELQLDAAEAPLDDVTLLLVKKGA
jgi:serine phosphatase RsbU (regulator of sigma subunit)